MQEELNLLEQQLDSHLEFGNKVTIISAPYGNGKTWFVDHFFNKTESGQKFNLIHLFPINYSIASNTDIFELIKYDILLELLKHDPKLLSVDMLNKVALKISGLTDYIQKNWGSIISKILTHTIKEFTQINKIIPEDVIKDICTTLESSKETKVESFQEQKIESIGSIYENNVITQVINEGLKNLKESNQYSRNVLVIDDLDRIDPEHIFRLLNIFAAHLDSNSDITPKKFAFDHIIFVCDLNNLELLFKQRYGSQDSWQGFIDKFYSRDTFQLKNKSVLKYFFRTTIKQLLINLNLKANWLSDSNTATSLVEDIIDFGINQNLINFRQIKRLQNLTLFSERVPVIGLDEGYATYEAINPYIIIWIGLLAKIFGGLTDLKRFLGKYQNEYNTFDPKGSGWYLSTLLPLYSKEHRNASTLSGFRGYSFQVYTLNPDNSLYSKDNLISVFLQAIKTLESLSIRPDLYFTYLEEVDNKSTITTIPA